MSWTVILLLAAGCYLEKAAGMLLFGRFSATGRFRAIGALLPPALMAALIGLQTYGDAGDPLFDTRLAGVVAGGLAAWRNAPFWLVVIIAGATTALLRAV